MYMQAQCCDGRDCMLRFCTRVEAHLALVKFRPHSILQRGIKTQTWLLLWGIIRNTRILPSSLYEWWDTSTSVCCCFLSCMINRPRWLKWAVWQQLLCEKFGLLKNPSDQTCQRKSSHATKIIHHPHWKLGKRDRLDKCIHYYFTENRSNKLYESLWGFCINHHDRSSTIFIIIAVFRHLVAQIDGKMPRQLWISSK